MVKKASTQIGIAIIAMAILLLLGGIFVDDGNSKSNYIKNKNSNDNDYESTFGHNNYLFYLNDTEIGRQKKVVESFPNIELGSKEEYNKVFIGNNFKLSANPFTKTKYSFDVQLSDVEDINQIMLYFTPDRITGDSELLIKMNGEVVVQTQARSNDIPIAINNKIENDTIKLTFELVKPDWYKIWKWNKFEIKNLEVVEVKQDRDNNQREFNFQVDKTFLERVYVDLAISCENVKERSDPIKVMVNGYIISNNNPECVSRYSKISANVPLNILSNEKNELVFETTGYYKVAYGVNKVYYNDQDVYKFTINSFNDIIDVVMYGDFDEDVIDIRLNSQTFTLARDEIKSIIPYLRFGVNELKILTKPLEIKELIIEKNEFLY